MTLVHSQEYAKSIYRLKREEKKRNIYPKYRSGSFFLRMLLEGRNLTHHLPTAKDRRIGLYYNIHTVLYCGIPLDRFREDTTEFNEPTHRQLYSVLSLSDDVKTEISDALRVLLLKSE
jgi:hypothetical protein